MTYESNIDKILGELVLRLKEVASFDNRVYKHSFTKLTDYPSCVVNLLIDRVTPAAAYQWHNLVIIITVFEGTAATKTADDLIASTGALIDKLDEYKTNPDKWVSCLVDGDIVYGFEKRQKITLLISMITVTIKKKW